MQSSPTDRFRFSVFSPTHTRAMASSGLGVFVNDCDVCFRHSLIENLEKRSQKC